MKITKICLNCHKEFKVKPSHLQKRVNCSQDCRNKTVGAKISLSKMGKRYVMWISKSCNNCGKVFDKLPSEIKKNKSGKHFCSKECAYKIMIPPSIFKKGHTPWSKLNADKMPRGKNNPAWIGGRVNHGDGYFLIRVNGKYLMEHRYLMEEYLGYKLDKDKHVHHINGDKQDNALENLVVLDRIEHGRLHGRGQKWNRP